MTSTYPPAWYYGGITKAVYEITNELSKRGHNVEVWTSDALDLHSRVKSVDVSTIKAAAKVRYFKNLSFTLTRMLNIHVTLDMVTSAKRELRNFDVVHLHGARIFQNVAVYPYAKKYGVPYVFQARGSLPRIMTKRRLKWIYDVFFGYRLLRDASKVIALTRREVQQYRDMGVPEKKIAVIPNAIDLSEYTNLPPKGPFRKKFSINNDKKIILYLGRLHKIKGIDILIKAYAHLAKSFNSNNALLVIVGQDDGYLSEAKHLVSLFGLEDNVLFTGPLYGRDKLEAYIDADIFVLPSKYEAFPNVLLEAFACSKPVIAPKISSIPDIVTHGKTGLLFKSCDTNNLSNTIYHTLTHFEEANQMAFRARKFVKEHFTTEKVVSKLEKLYEEAIQG